MTMIWNFLIPLTRVREKVNTPQRCSFFIANLDMFLSDSTQKISLTFDKVNDIESDQWSLKQCEFTF